MSERATTDPDDATLEISLQALAARLGKTPTVVDMHERGDFHPEVYVACFGSWENALEAANLDPDDMGAKLITDYELLDELQRIAEEVEHSPTRGDLEAHGEYSYKTYQDRFGSWSTAKEEAMLDTEKLSESELLRELRRVARAIEAIPRVKDMEERGEYAPVTYHRRFGSWLDALDEADLLR